MVYSASNIYQYFPPLPASKPSMRDLPPPHRNKHSSIYEDAFTTFHLHSKVPGESFLPAHMFMDEIQLRQLNYFPSFNTDLLLLPREHPSSTPTPTPTPTPTASPTFTASLCLPPLPVGGIPLQPRYVGSWVAW